MENGVSRKQMLPLQVIMVLQFLLRVVQIPLFTFKKNKAQLNDQKMKFLLILIPLEELIPIINQLLITRPKQRLIFKPNLPKFHHSTSQIRQIKTQTQVKHKNLFNRHLLNFSLVAAETVKLMNAIECILHWRWFLRRRSKVHIRKG